MKKEGIQDHDRYERCRYQRQLKIDAYHKIQRQRYQHAYPEKRSHLLGNKGLDCLHVGGASLQYVSGMIFLIPGNRQIFYMRKQLIPYGLYESL